MEPEQAGGGTVATIRMVASFYSQVLASPLLYRHFVGVPMEVLVAKQSSFIETIVRGDPGYSATELKQLHAHLSIGNPDFDELMRILDDSLLEHGVEPKVRSLIHDSFESFRPVIVYDPPA